LILWLQITSSPTPPPVHHPSPLYPSPLSGAS
jgi:hypothetical protein